MKKSLFEMLGITDQERIHTPVKSNWYRLAADTGSGQRRVVCHTPITGARFGRCLYHGAVNSPWGCTSGKEIGFDGAIWFADDRPLNFRPQRFM